MEITVYDGGYLYWITVDDLKKYKNFGLLNYVVDKPLYKLNSVTATLTEEGKKYYIRDAAKRQDYSREIIVKRAKLNFFEITGIQIFKEMNSAKVEYKIKRTNISPFGKADNAREFIKKSITFTKYDDGWRIN